MAVVTEDMPRHTAIQQRLDGQNRRDCSEEEDDDGGERLKKSAAGTATIAALLRLVSQAAKVARAEGWGCQDLLDAVTRDVITFANNVGLPSRLAPSPWLPGRRNNVKSRVRMNKTDSVSVATSGRELDSNIITINGRASRSSRPSSVTKGRGMMRMVHRPQDAAPVPAGMSRAAHSKRVNRNRPNRPAVPDQNGSLDLVVGSIKYDMSTNPFVNR